MKKLRFSDDLTVPVDWITLATVVYGARGSGKTCFGRVAAEEAHKARQRFCAIDLKGDWYGLKSSADGKHDGIPVVVFGGDHEDLPLEDGAGAFVGETVAGLRQSCILDFENFSKGKRTRFLADFFEALYRRNREPLLLLLDESQAYAPQKPGPEEARTLGAVQDIVKLGRKHGIGPVLFTQRGAGLNKEVSELCDVMVAFRTPGVLDQDRVKGWLDHNTGEWPEFLAGRPGAALSGLATGTAIFASSHPDLKLSGVHAVRRPETFDSSATPKVGQRRREPKKLADADVEAIRAKMGEAIERQKANDPKLLQARIAELEKDAKSRVDPKGLYTQIESLQAQLAEKVKRAETIRVPVVDKEVVAGLKTALNGLKNIGDEVTSLRDRFETVTTGIREITIIANRVKIPETLASAAAQPERSGYPSRNVPPKPMKLTRQSAPSAPGSAELGNTGLRRILIALAQRPLGLTRRQLAIRAGLSASSGTFGTYLSKGRTEGWIAGTQTFIVTDRGRDALGHWEPLPEGAALREYWLDQLGDSGAARILIALAETYPQSMGREELAIAAKMNQKSGTFGTYLSKLRTLELIEGRSELTMARELA